MHVSIAIVAVCETRLLTTYEPSGTRGHDFGGKLDPTLERASEARLRLNSLGIRQNLIPVTW